LPFILNRLRAPSPELDSIQLLRSQAHILAGERLESRDLTDSLTVSRNVTLTLTLIEQSSEVKGRCRAPFGAHDQIFSLLFDSYGLVFVGRPR
jgi:hypothetical protein